MNLGLVAAGLFIGVIIGLTGMGGGALTTPFLILFAGMRPVMAVGTDLVFAASTKLVGAATHLRHRTVDLKVTALLSAGAVPFAVAGVLVLQAAGGRADAFAKRALGVALMLVAASVLLRQLSRRPHKLVRQRWPLTVALGAVIGLLVGLTSVGSGSIMMAVLLLAYRILPSERLVGTDVFVGFLLSLAAGLAHWGAGNVNWGIAGSLLIGSIPGVYMGAKLHSKTPERVLRPVLAVVLLLTGLRMVI